MAFQIHIGPNIRKSPYFEATVAAGVRSFSVYNHMYIPGSFGDPAAEYRRLLEGVAIWDVGAQRQVEISGPDAGQLARYLTTRSLDGTRAGQGRYVPLCNHDGILINDPVLLKFDETRYWLSIADSDIALWADGIARERGLDVRVIEPDVAPMAIQGPVVSQFEISRLVFLSLYRLRRMLPKAARTHLRRVGSYNVRRIFKPSLPALTVWQVLGIHSTRFSKSASSHKDSALPLREKV